MPGSGAAVQGHPIPEHSHTKVLWNTEVRGVRKLENVRMKIELFHVLAAIAVLISVPLLVIRPRYVVLGFLALIIFFAMPMWGVAKGADIFNLYYKGVGVLPLSILTLTLYGLFGASLVFWKAGPATRICRARWYLLAFSILFIGYVIVGVVVEDVAFTQATSLYGVINIFSMFLFMLILLRAFPEPKNLEQLVKFVLACVLLRGIWLLIRYVFFGGDPANAYETLQDVNVKLTSYDVADMIFAAIVVAYAAWQVTWNRKLLRARMHWFYMAVIAIELAVIALSFRRAVWIGLMFVAIHLTMRQPWRRRIQMFVISSALAFVTFGFLAFLRLSKYSQGGYSGTLFYDLTVKGKISATEGRFRELAVAFDTIKENIFLGVGPWGGYGYHGLLEFMHSGPLHIWLKVGVVGLMLFLAALSSFVWFYLTKRKGIPPRHLGTFEAGFAAVLFTIPHFLVGSFMIEQRTLLAFGVALALPYLTYAAYGARRPHPLAPQRPVQSALPVHSSEGANAKSAC